jgi:hypothetical protein
MLGKFRSLDCDACSCLPRTISSPLLVSWCPGVLRVLVSWYLSPVSGDVFSKHAIRAIALLGRDIRSVDPSCSPSPAVCVPCRALAGTLTTTRIRSPKACAESAAIAWESMPELHVRGEYRRVNPYDAIRLACIERESSARLSPTVSGLRLD